MAPKEDEGANLLDPAKEEETENSGNERTAQERAEEDAALQDMLAEIKSINDDLISGNELVQEFVKLMEKSTALQNKVKAISLRSQREMKALNGRVKALPEEEQVKARGAINALGRKLEGLRKVRPETRSLFSRMMLGRVNVKCFSAPERERLRDEYNKFKLRTNAIFVMFPLVVLLFHYYLRHEWLDTHWINILHHLWLMYYFVSLALRENILLVNGSDIRSWWIYHHYLSAAGTVVWLVWPPTDLYISYVPYVTYLICYTGLVQTMQIMFYRKRDYANRALGKTGHMDISYPETLTELPKELVVLVPFLLLGHIWHFLLGLSFIRTLFTECDIFNKHWTEYREELQVATSGLLSLFLGGGNFISTILTVYSKTNKKRSMMARQADDENLKGFLDISEAQKRK
ncbi:Transmembrane protein 120-like [Hondaea fermentalgiana]|uniref:Transmembrane protein 120-like n=1 Tax=Hondaea fermentalgiana TaxID=2315210 RepID=A0A2R5H115_9STRA|nr:Transmembrane protein 120-like [Hondaea fermentalgiana]|eukprot:GBG34014.1 Transmembrane protein 120-like [Hondaea fermentalgiana]